MKKKGFTLVEMLAVIALIAVLSVVAVSTYRGINESSKKKALEAKIQQIESAAEKWTRENNITNGMSISVNTLVVEGYLSADEAGTDGLAVIRNPVTSENMICNVVELSFKNGVIASHFNGNVYNCKLATQSLVDSNINIRVVSKSGTNLTGPGSSSIAKWTNEDVAIIVNSDTYDAKATSISYDFGGNTYTKNKDTLSKYSGTSFVNEEDSKLYYNVYYIESELLLNSKIIVTYAIPGESTKSRAYTIRFDKEESTATLKSNSEWLTADSKAQITVDDGKGSGPAAIYFARDPVINNATKELADPVVTLQGLDIGKYYIWTEDKAGNISHTYKMILEINNIDPETPGCEVVFDGIPGDHGWYIGDEEHGDVTPIGQNTPEASISGINLGVNTDINNPVYTGFAAYNTIGQGAGEVRKEETPKEGIPYYCHARSLAGLYSNASRILYLDRTAPDLAVTVDNPNTHEQHKTVHVRIHDGLSGLNTSTRIQYGLSMSNTVEPTTWSDVVITTSAQNNDVVTKDFSTTEAVTGTWYLWIRGPEFKDYAGNVFKGNVGGTSNSVFGPYKFDNTPPTCDADNGKTNWTNGEYQILEYCGDEYGTTDQSGCTQPIFTAMYYRWDSFRRDSLTIRDNAGNTTSCEFNLYLDNIKPSCHLTEPGPDGDNGWYKSASVTITASFQDNGDPDVQSGVNITGTASTPRPTNGRTSVTYTQNSTSLTTYCFVEDVAGNQGTSALTIKKDDGSEADAGGCVRIYGNTTWTNNSPVTWGYKLNTRAISGCHEGVDEAGMIWTNSCTAYQNYYQSTKTLNFNGYILFFTNSGVTIRCSHTSHNIYLDTKAPDCDISKSNTWSTSGVKVSMSCTDQDNLSGCKNNSSSWSGVKSSGTYTVKDRAGNSCSKYINVYKSSCNCDWTEWSCYQTDTNNSGDTSTHQVGCTSCTDAATCTKSYRCCERSYECETCYY